MTDSKDKNLRRDGFRNNKAGEFSFLESRTHVVFTLRQVVENLDPVLFVIHDSDEADWQFLTGKPVLQKDLLLVSLESLVATDHTLNELADLPQGWYATRQTNKSAWERKQIIDWS
jgi:hypothetical protein